MPHGLSRNSSFPNSTRNIQKCINEIPRTRRNKESHLHKGSYKDGISRRVSSVARMCIRTGYSETRFPEELTACGHKIPQVVHVIRKLVQAVSRIASPRAYLAHAKEESISSSSINFGWISYLAWSKTCCLSPINNNPSVSLGASQLYEFVCASCFCTDRCRERFFVAAMSRCDNGSQIGIDRGSRAESRLSPITFSRSMRPKDQGPAGGTRCAAVSRGLRLALSIRHLSARQPCNRADRCAQRCVHCMHRVSYSDSRYNART